MNRAPMIRVIRPLAGVVCGLAIAAVSVHPAAAPPVQDRVWFSPNPGTLDLQRMFEHPEEWSQTRALMSVYNFTQQHTFAVPDPIVGPNSYAALARPGAFQTLTQWGKKTVVGVGAADEFYSTTDASGPQEAVRSTLAAIDAVTAASGKVTYLSMDEPWVSGRSRQCDGPALDKTADRVAAYMGSVGRARPE